MIQAIVKEYHWLESGTGLKKGTILDRVNYEYVHKSSNRRFSNEFIEKNPILFEIKEIYLEDKLKDFFDSNNIPYTEKIINDLLEIIDEDHKDRICDEFE